MKSNLLALFLDIVAFGVTSKNLLPNSGHEDVPQDFFLGVI